MDKSDTWLDIYFELGALGVARKAAEMQREAAAQKLESLNFNLALIIRAMPLITDDTE